MLQTNDNTNQVHQWVMNHFPLAKEKQIDASTSLLDSGIVDSMGTLDIVMFIEENFGIVVGEEDMVVEHFESVGSIANFISGKLAQ